MSTGPFVANTKVPPSRVTAEERLRRLEEAIEFLLQQLAAGPQPAKVLIQAAKSAGVAERTLHWAKDVLGVTTEHTGWHGQRIWQPPAPVLASQGAIVAS